MTSFGQRIELLRTIAHPARIRILQELAKGVRCMSDFQDFLGISQPNVSQHLSVLRSRGIIDFYIDGRLKCYFLVEPRIPDILEILKRDNYSALPAPACCPVTRKGIYPGERRR